MNLESIKMRWKAIYKMLHELFHYELLPFVEIKRTFRVFLIIEHGKPQIGKDFAKEFKIRLD